MPNNFDIKKLPPLKSLKGFEVAARLKSVRGAGEELNLTHPAITHQIHTLEEKLGIKLFSREGRNIALTAEGKIFYPFVREAFEKLIEGVDAVHRAAISPSLRVQSYITFSMRWLLHGLQEFRGLHPEIKVDLDTHNGGWDFNDVASDVGVIFTRKPISDEFHWVKLFDSKVFPVCSPGLLVNKGELQPGQLCELPLISVSTENEYWTWAEWCQSAGLSAASAESNIVVDSLVMALEMAVNGEGVALVNGPVADADLKAGRLVKPVQHSVDGGGQWGIICRKDMKEDPRVKIFIEWLSGVASRF